MTFAARCGEAGLPSKEARTEHKAPYTSASLYESRKGTAYQIVTAKPDMVPLLDDLRHTKRSIN
jgi:hypothetical protein